MRFPILKYEKAFLVQRPQHIQTCSVAVFLLFHSSRAPWYTKTYYEITLLVARHNSRGLSLNLKIPKWPESNVLTNDFPPTHSDHLWEALLQVPATANEINAVQIKNWAFMKAALVF